jgi:hypothetical protein
MLKTKRRRTVRSARSDVDRLIRLVRTMSPAQIPLGLGAAAFDWRESAAPQKPPHAVFKPPRGTREYIEVSKGRAAAPSGRLEAFLPSGSKQSKEVVERQNGERIRGLEVWARHRATRPMSTMSTRMFDTSYPWRTVGIVKGPGHAGSGTLIHPHMVLTAAHVITDDPTGYVFVVQSADGSLFAQASVWGFAQFKNVDKSSPNGFDFAVLAISPALGNTLGWMGTAWGPDSMYTSQFWTCHGFPSFTPTVEIMLPVEEIDDEGYGGLELETRTFADEDKFKGWSGGPLWGSPRGFPGPRVVGVLSGVETEYHFPAEFPRWQVFAGGPAMGRLILAAFDHWGNVQV